MARRRLRDQTIWFPWERRGSLLRRVGLARARPFTAAVAMALFVLFLGARERRQSGIRSTRTTLGEVHVALDAYRADHDRKCPAALVDLRREGYLPPRAGETAPLDAWGRPLRLTCPGRKDPDGYDLASDGPDGEMGALSRVE